MIEGEKRISKDEDKVISNEEGKLSMTKNFQSNIEEMNARLFLAHSNPVENISKLSSNANADLANENSKGGLHERSAGYDKLKEEDQEIYEEDPASPKPKKLTRSFELLQSGCKAFSKFDQASETHILASPRH